MPTSETGPFILPYSGIYPNFAGLPEAPVSAAVLGRVTMGRNARLAPYSVIRADGHYVSIGDDFWLGAHGTVHIAHDVSPTHIGNRVSAGANAIIHACDVGSNCVVGNDVVILDGSRIGDNVALADGSIVYPRSVLESGYLYAGRPAKLVCEVNPGELDAMHHAMRARVLPPEVPLGDTAGNRARGVHFIANNAALRGRVSLGDNVGVWFGCALRGGVFGISVGDRTNIQDNTTICSIDRSVEIGKEVTIGHNVTMSDCTVMSRSLVGMGATVMPGTIIHEDVLLAAGAITQVGQVLESGWLYGGSPARKLSRLDDKKRAIIMSTWPVYMEYARRFDQEQSVKVRVWNN